MNNKSIGNNIKEIRINSGLRQEDLAERTGLSVNYIGAVERGEKNPSLETFINICNALNTSADIILSNVLKTGYKVKASILTEKIEKLNNIDRQKIIEIVDILTKYPN